MEDLKEYDAGYNIRECCKCGKAMGAKTQYVEALKALYVICNECGYVYRMNTKDGK